jgi:hypothetical protein
MGSKCREWLHFDEMGDPQELFQLFETFKAEFAPLDRADEALVERLTAAYWRLARFGKIEAGIFQSTAARILRSAQNLPSLYPEVVGAADPSCESAGDLQTLAFIADATGPDCFLRLARYESRLEREFDRTLRLLLHRRATRLPLTHLTEARRQRYDPHATAAGSCSESLPAPRSDRSS